MRTVIPSSIQLVGANSASGAFKGGGKGNVGIGIESGVILSSGNVKEAVGPNQSDGTSTIHGQPGDPDLNALIPQSTNDAVYLQFDFITNTEELSFKYVFASEEYNEYANTSFNDVFAFFLNGENIALIPGTTTPVSINNVNGGNPFGTDANNDQFYNNNDLNDPGPATFNVEYDGFTDVFTASVTGLGSGINTIKLAIADAGDSFSDSAVFLEGGSFSGGPDPQDTPESSTLIALLGIGFLGTVSKVTRKK